MKNRATRARIAQETVAISQRGSYIAPDNTTVSIADDVAAAIEATRLYRPGELPTRRALPFELKATTFEVTGETTLAAARRLVATHPSSHVCFAVVDRSADQATIGP